MAKAPPRRRKRSRPTTSQSASKKSLKHKKNKSKKPRKRLRKRPRSSWRRRLAQVFAGAVLGGALAAAIVLWHLDRTITIAFEGRRWDVPAHVYAQPLELYEGLRIEVEELERALVKLGYRKVVRASEPGTFARSRSAIELVSRPFRFWDGVEPATDAFIRFAGGRVGSLTDSNQRQKIPILRLDPLLVGSLYPGVVEDRMVIAPDEVPELLREALLVVEDRRFFAHFGLDLRGIARAAWVNLTSGEVRQGGSTLTQQLVKSYFLDNRRTLARKIVEAAMAVLLERRYGKEQLLNAYVNEIYLGQDGPRAIHGFALASRYHFGRPLKELEPHQLALLVAMVRGPSHYDPRRQPERARARRNHVLERMQEAGKLDPDVAAAQKSRPLMLAQKPVRGASYYPAFMSLVRRQLVRDFREQDLAREGLSVFTTLDPLLQERAERALAQRIDRLATSVTRGLEGAVVVTSVDGAEVLAAVGGRDAAFDGFNRALDARRPIGSLIKPVVYLAAIESGRFHLASPVDDAPLTLELEDQKEWSPQNYDKEFVGPMPLVRALAESRNLPAVRVGMATGLDRVADMLGRLGYAERVRPFPSLLLGAVAMSPFDVAQIYNTLASGGSLMPLRGVRFVLDQDGQRLTRYPLKLRQVAATQDVAQVNAGLVTAMRRGTGRSAMGRLPAGLEVAGKTGTTDDLRDSWFAGFSGDRVAVVWLGRDDNQPAGLSGAAGALQVWLDLFAAIAAEPVTVETGDTLELAWVDYLTGLESDPGCGDTVPVVLPKSAGIGPQPGCEPGRKRGLRKRALDWIRDIIE